MKKQTGIRWMLLGIALLLSACFCCLYIAVFDPDGGNVMGFLCGWSALLLPPCGLAFCLVGFFYKPKTAPSEAEKDNENKSE